jgi:hypothetical protein
MSDERYGTCRFCVIYSKGRPECRRRSPRIMQRFLLGITFDFMTMWPDTELDEWCGEWEGETKS